ncbi:MAG: glycosyltransferase family 4 protein [Phycisphaeraceae bacterium]
MDDARECRIGMVSTRFAGTDGVSLESAKWASVLEDLGHECFYFAGESDRPAERSHVLPEAHFQHPLIQQINADLFEGHSRSPATSELVQDLRRTIKNALHAFVREKQLELLIVENALSLPMNVPLGLAITELVSETRIPTIAHHHDFAWERSRYTVHAANDYLQAAFPPAMAEMAHVVLNSYAAHELARRAGLGSTQIPNVMDFDNPPAAPDGYCRDLRNALGLEPDEYFLLQPTRVVPRKRIERSIELARQIRLPCALVISHACCDESPDYQKYLREYADVMGVRLIFAGDLFSQARGRTPADAKIYSLHDAYFMADLVTYPSSIEGFGNAFLEAIYYRKPLVMSSYDTFIADIEPMGFNVIEFGEFITDATVQQVRRALEDPASYSDSVERNYRLARKHFSYTSLRHDLEALFEMLPSRLPPRTT